MKDKAFRSMAAGGAAGLLCALLPVAPASAVTANANVYGVTPQWGGWCTGPLNKVTRVKWANHTLGKSGGDSGDDVVYFPVRKGVANSITMGVTCKYATPTGMNFSIKPSRNKQTFWFRLNGTTKHN